MRERITKLPSAFRIPKAITTTTDKYHYYQFLNEVSRILRIRKQRCLFHIEKDLSHKTKEEHMEDKLSPANKLIKHVIPDIGEYLSLIVKIEP